MQRYGHVSIDRTRDKNGTAIPVRTFTTVLHGPVGNPNGDRAVARRLRQAERLASK